MSEENLVVTGCEKSNDCLCENCTPDCEKCDCEEMVQAAEPVLKLPQRFIAPDELKKVKDLSANVNTATLILEKVTLEKRMTEMMLQNEVMRLYIKYGIGPDFVINDQTGEITHKDSQQSVT